MSICNVVSPIILLLYTQIEVDIERPPVEHVWTELMGIILAVTAWMVPFLNKIGVQKGNGISPFAVSIDIPHALGELVEEYFKILAPDRKVCITGTVDEDDKEVEQVYDDAPSVGNCAYNTAGDFGNRFQNIKKSEVDTYLNVTDNIIVEENTVNYNTQ